MGGAQSTLCLLYCIIMKYEIFWENLKIPVGSDAKLKIQFAPSNYCYYPTCNAGTFFINRHFPGSPMQYEFITSLQNKHQNSRLKPPVSIPCSLTKCTYKDMNFNYFWSCDFQPITYITSGHLTFNQSDALKCTLNCILYT